MPKRGQVDRGKEKWWRGTIERWKASGLTQAEFCRREGLKDWSLSEWRRRLGEKAAMVIGHRSKKTMPAVEFAPVTVHAAPEPTAVATVTDSAVANLEVILIRIPDTASSESVRTLLEALRSTC